MGAEAATVVAAGRSPGAVVARLTAHKAVRSGVLWGCVFGSYVASQAYAYASTYKTPAARASLVEEFGSNTGIAAIVGPAHDIGTVAGFTVWKCLAVLGVLGAVWGMLTATRLLRGEEDAGRWELLLAGQTTRRRAAVQGLGGLAVGLAAMWVVTAVITALVGRSSRVDIGISASMFLALASVSSAGMFLAIGTLTSQLAATRRQAASYAAAVVGVSYGVRMVADSGAGLDWLRWASPLGWIEELQPLTSPRPWAMAPIIGLSIVVGGLAVHLAGVRDLGASVFPDHASAPARTRLLFGPAGLSVRLVRPTMLGWFTAIGAMGLLLGLVAKSAGVAMASAPSFHRVLSRLGARGNGATAYLGVVFLIVAVLVSLIALGQVTAARSEESTGRLEHLLVRPFSRSAWLSDRLGIAAIAVVASGVLAGVATWIGASIERSGIELHVLLEAGVNVVPPALCILGIGAATFGLVPRVSTVVSYGLLVWSFLVELIGGVVGMNHLVLDTSILHQMASAPAVSPDWTTNAILVATGLAAAAVGAVAFSRRDLASD
jgi:ABC-2 type transport system permease protein